MPRPVLLLVNPHARRAREDVDEVVAALGDAGLAARLEHTEDPSSFRELIQRYASEVDRVIVAGGDGTLNEAVQVLVELDLPLGIIPLGTANNLARTLDIPTDPRKAGELIAAGRRRRIDLGRVNGRYFCTTASIGLSVQITEELSSSAKRRWGPIAYVLAALRAIRRSHTFHADIAWEGGTRHSRTVQIVVGNGRYYGAALAVAPDATIDDARLDLYSIEVNHWWDLLKLAPSLKWGTHVNRPEVEALRAAAFEIHTRKPMPVDLDGELAAETPARFQVVRGALEVFAPAPPVS